MLFRSSAAENIVLTASDSAGMTGASNPFNVYATNDLSLTVAASPSPAAVSNNLVYTVKVMNAGPDSATSVNVTNTLPGNISYVSATSSQGTPQYANGKVTCSVGTLASLASATITITVTPTNAGVTLTNIASVAKSESESILSNNTATVTTYVPPILSFYASILIGEGNVGTRNAPFFLTLSSPSILTVSCDVGTSDDTALAGSDYVAVSGRLNIPPRTTLFTFSVPIQGDTVVEPEERFLAYISNPTNATFKYDGAWCTITNDDGLTNQINYLSWGQISSPQRTNQPFSVTITAKDGSNNTATTFASTNILRGVNIGGATSATLITNDVHSLSDNLGLFTLGYEFTPTNNIFVTHVRQYSGTKVSLWTSGGFLLASTNVDTVPGDWVETELSKPVFLIAGSHYRVGVFTGGTPYYWRSDASPAFAFGTIDQSYYSFGDDQ